MDRLTRWLAAAVLFGVALAGVPEPVREAKGAIASSYPPVLRE